MATVTLIKKSAHKNFLAAMPKAAPGKVVGHAIVIPDVLPDDGTLSFSLTGVDAAGNPVALDPTVVTATAVSDTPAVITVDAFVGLSSTLRAATPAPAIGATANVTITATWASNPPAGSPFNFVWALSIGAGAVVGITVVPGTISG
jgi:hypothetical protein